MGKSALTASLIGAVYSLAPFCYGQISRSSVLINAQTYVISSSVTLQLGNLLLPIQNPGFQNKQCDFRVGILPKNGGVGLNVPICQSLLYPSEAYMWGGYDSTGTFRSHVYNDSYNLVLDSKGIPLYPSGANKGQPIAGATFTGIDCSGFIGRAWGLPSHANFATSSIPAFVTNIDLGKLRPGDILLDSSRETGSGGGHVILVTTVNPITSFLLPGTVVSNSTLQFEHATSATFLNLNYVWSVIADTASVDCIGSSCLVSNYSVGYGGHHPGMQAASPFPQFGGFQLSSGTVVGISTFTVSSTPVVTVNIQSPKSVPIDANSVILAIDGFAIPVFSTNTISASNLTFSASISTPLADGAHLFSTTAADRNGRIGLNLVDTSIQTFNVDTTGPTVIAIDINKNALGQIIKSTSAVVIYAADSGSGVCYIALSDPNGNIVSSGTFSASSATVLGPFPALSTGPYVATSSDCVNNPSQLSFTVSTGSPQFSACAGYSPYKDYAGCALPVTVDTTTINRTTMTAIVSLQYDCTDITVSSTTCATFIRNQLATADCNILSSGTPTCVPFPLAPKWLCSGRITCGFSTISPTTAIKLNASTSSASSSQLFVSEATLYYSTGGVMLDYIHNGANVSLSSAPQYAALLYSQIGSTATITSGDGVVTAATYLNGVNISSETGDLSMIIAQNSNSFAKMAQLYQAQDPDFLFTSTAAISFSTSAPPGVVFDTATLALYQYNGISWSSATVINQHVSIVGGVVTVSGAYTRSGHYAAFYNGRDVYAPSTTFGVQGTSSTFNGTLFVSTISYAVLIASDPVVNGYASQVRTTFYRLDPSTYSSSWWIYGSTIPLPIGAHSMQYYSQDYAGNIEVVHTSTFVVTAGSVFQELGNYATAGKFLVGSSTNGIQLEVQPGSQNNYSLLVSSPDSTPLFTADAVGDVGVNNPFPITPLDIQGTGATGDIALQLRSGNAASTSSVQGTFCFSGTTSMCHALTTQHNSSSDLGNRMDFYLWNSGVSTGTKGNTDVLALQAITAIAGQGAVHVMPVGAPNVELEVSNGSCTGCGTIDRIWAGQPSSRARKSDIRYLSEKDAAQAYRDVMVLKHAAFRYKTRGRDGELHSDPGQPLREGLIYEDTPESIHGSSKSIVIDDRVVNLELALQEDIRRLQKLEERLKELQQ